MNGTVPFMHFEEIEGYMDLSVINGKHDRTPRYGKQDLAAERREQTRAHELGKPYRFTDFLREVEDGTMQPDEVATYVGFVARDAKRDREDVARSLLEHIQHSYDRKKLKQLAGIIVQLNLVLSGHKA